MSEQTDFETHFPKITETTIIDAVRVFGSGHQVVSLNGKATGLDAFVMMLATDSETAGPFLLTGFCARELCARLLAAGFGP